MSKRERHGRLALAHPVDGARRHRERREPGRAAERLLRARVGVVDAPRVGETSSPPSEVTQSTSRSASGAWPRIELAQLLHRVPDAGRRLGVHDATSFVSGFASSAASTSSERHDLAERRGELDEVGAGARRAISAIRAPKNPAWITMTLSPGSIRFAKPASMPEVPEALKQSERPSAWRQSALQPVDEIEQDVPEVGVEVPVHRERIASRTSGLTFEGPGPHSSRSPGSRAGIERHELSHGLSFPSSPSRSAGRDEGPEHRARHPTGGSPPV